MPGPQADFQGQILRGAEELLDRVEASLHHSLSAVELQLGHLTLDNEESIDPDVMESMQRLAGRLASITGQGLQMLQSMDSVVPGVVPVIEGPLVARPTLELGAGELGADSSTDDPEPLPNNGAKTPKDLDLEDTTIDRRTKRRQVITLVNIFGDEHLDQIAQLDQGARAYFGSVVQHLYSNIKIGSRGRSTQADRARQFADYIAGHSREDMANEYGLDVESINPLLHKATAILRREVPQETLTRIFNESLSKYTDSKRTQD